MNEDDRRWPPTPGLKVAAARLSRSLDAQEQRTESASGDSVHPAVIFRGCSPDDLVHAAGVASWGLTDMPGTGAVVVRGGRKFGLRRNKASLTVWLERKEAAS